MLSLHRQCAAHGAWLVGTHTQPRSAYSRRFAEPLSGGGGGSPEDGFPWLAGAQYRLVSLASLTLHKRRLRLQGHMAPVKPSYSQPLGCKSPSLAFLPRADSPSNIPSQPLLTNHRLVAHPCSTLVAVASPRARCLDMFNPGAEPGPSKRRAPKTASGENKVYVSYRLTHDYPAGQQRSASLGPPTLGRHVFHCHLPQSGH